MAIHRPPFWNPFVKGQWYAISPDGAKKLIGEANLKDAIGAAGLAVLLSLMADEPGNLKTVEDSKLRNDGIDPHAVKREAVGKDESRKYNIAKDSEQNVYLVPVKKGERKPVALDIKYPELNEEYPLRKKK